MQKRELEPEFTIRKKFCSNCNATTDCTPIIQSKTDGVYKCLVCGGIILE